MLDEAKLYKMNLGFSNNFIVTTDLSHNFHATPGKKMTVYIETYMSHFTTHT